VKVELGAAGDPAPADLLNNVVDLENVPLSFPVGADVESFGDLTPPHSFVVPTENVNDEDPDNEFDYEIRGVYSVSYEPH
jgi:hypothetical protein